MNKWVSLLLLSLSVSVALNLYFLFTPSEQNPFVHSQDKNGHIQKTDASKSHLNWAYTDKPNTSQNQDQAVLDSANEAKSRAELLAQANFWLKDRNFLTLSAFLQDYLKQHPQDMDFLLLEAKLKVETSLLSDAIAHYYDLLRNPMTAAQQQEIELQIEQLSTHSIEQLQHNYSWDILAMFVEPLLQIEPNNRLYILSLATAYAELYQEGLMENVLASLDFDDPDAQKIREIILAQQIPPAKTDDFEADDSIANIGRPIPLKQFGDQYVVEAKLSSNQVSLLIDTGASVTAISKQYFDNLSNGYKVNYLGRFNIGTAGGRIMASMYQFRELTIQHVTVQNLPVVILPMQGIENADGLLGMNFLREFDFKIDQQQSVMFIK